MVYGDGDELQEMLARHDKALDEADLDDVRVVNKLWHDAAADQNEFWFRRCDSISNHWFWVATIGTGISFTLGIAMGWFVRGLL